MAEIIKRDALKKMMEYDDDFILVDVLDRDEFQKYHLPGAINLPLRDFDEFRTLVTSNLPDKTADIVVYCMNQMCGASEEAARELTKLGYTNVKEYADGKRDWLSAGLPVEKN